ncbi:MAG: methyl-accepting chemotaxis protein [Treponema sp.]|jgi:methyl-accepting chemotaxis protein|nr:methyl-accepting chemotaxis protein [Treponema sp.]
MKSLKTRFFLLFTGLGIFIALGVGMGMYMQYVKYIKTTYRKTLTNVLKLVENQFPVVSDPDYLVQEGTAGAEEYWNLIYRINDVVSTFDLAYIYFLRPSAHTYQFVFSSEWSLDTPEDMFNIYDPVDIPDEINRAYITKAIVITQKPYSDEWGTFVSAYMPVFKDGKVVGILGADYDVSFVKNLEREALLALFAALVLAVLLSGILAIGVSASLINPIKYSIAVLTTIAAGDLTFQIETADTEQRSVDEIGLMMRLLHQTQEGIKALVVAIEDKADSLSVVGNELSTMMTQSAAAIHEISAITQGMKAKAINQAASVNETNATMGQIILNIEHLNTNIEKQAESISRSSSAIEEMVANIASVTKSLIQNEQNVQELSEASDHGYTALQQVSMDIQDVAQESERLLEINRVIQNIASQTNLLAMNAAIEAAHAGEVGKGFAVVADEIRKLAESSSEQAKTVSVVLKKITQSLGGISNATVVVLNHFDIIDQRVKTVSEQEGHIRMAMEEQEAGSKDILSAITTSNTITQNVRCSSEAMMTGSKEIIGEGKNLEMLSADLTNGMNETASGMDQINTAVMRIQEISLENTQSIEVLVREITKFKIA